MVKERSASDVLLALEQRMDTLEGMIRSIDHNVKVLLNRQNASQLQVQPAQQMPKMPQEIISGNAEISKKITVEAPDSNVEFVQEPKEVGNNKRVVQEKLTYEDSKVIILAQVEIFDTNGKLIDKRKTNNSGKWTSSLLPGKYVIRVAKPQTSVKPQVTGKYEIVVPPGDKPLQLESRKL